MGISIEICIECGEGIDGWDPDGLCHACRQERNDSREADSDDMGDSWHYDEEVSGGKA